MILERFVGRVRHGEARLTGEAAENYYRSCSVP